MKKFVLKISAILIILLAFTACKTKRGGCGLTSDAEKIEHTIQVQKLSKVSV